MTEDLVKHRGTDVQSLCIGKVNLQQKGNKVYFFDETSEIVIGKIDFENKEVKGFSSFKFEREDSI